MGKLKTFSMYDFFSIICDVCLVNFFLDEACCKIVLKVKSLPMKKELSFWSNKIEAQLSIFLLKRMKEGLRLYIANVDQF